MSDFPARLIAAASNGSSAKELDALCERPSDKSSLRKELLFACVPRGHADVLEWVLPSETRMEGVRPPLFTLRDDRYRTLLHRAVSTRQHGMVGTLLSTCSPEADIALFCAVDGGGHTALQIACQMRDEVMIEKLLQAMRMYWRWNLMAVRAIDMGALDRVRESIRDEADADIAAFISSVLQEIDVERCFEYRAGSIDEFEKLREDVCPHLEWFPPPVDIEWSARCQHLLHEALRRCASALRVDLVVWLMDAWRAPYFPPTGAPSSSLSVADVACLSPDTRRQHESSAVGQDSFQREQRRGAELRMSEMVISRWAGADASQLLNILESHRNPENSQGAPWESCEFRFSGRFEYREALDALANQLIGSFEYKVEEARTQVLSAFIDRVSVFGLPSLDILVREQESTLCRWLVDEELLDLHAPMEEAPHLRVHAGDVAAFRSSRLAPWLEEDARCTLSVGETLCFLAASYGSLAILIWLIDEHSMSSDVRAGGETLLHVAVAAEQFITAKWLAEREPELVTVLSSKTGLSPAHQALRESQDSAMVDYFLALPSHADREGKDCLHHALHSKNATTETKANERKADKMFHELASADELASILSGDRDAAAYFSGMESVWRAQSDWFSMLDGLDGDEQAAREFVEKAARVIRTLTQMCKGIVAHGRADILRLLLTSDSFLRLEQLVRVLPSRLQEVMQGNAFFMLGFGCRSGFQALEVEDGLACFGLRTMLESASNRAQFDELLEHAERARRIRPNSPQDPEKLLKPAEASLPDERSNDHGRPRTAAAETDQRPEVVSPEQPADADAAQPSSQEAGSVNDDEAALRPLSEGNGNVDDDELAAPPSSEETRTVDDDEPAAPPLSEETGPVSVNDNEPAQQPSAASSKQKRRRRKKG